MKVLTSEETVVERRKGVVIAARNGGRRRKMPREERKSQESVERVRKMKEGGGKGAFERGNASCEGEKMAW